MIHAARPPCTQMPLVYTRGQTKESSFLILHKTCIQLIFLPCSVTLWWASHFRLAGMVQYLVDIGSDVNATHYSQSILGTCILGCMDEQILITLVDAGADISTLSSVDIRFLIRDSSIQFIQKLKLTGNAYTQAVNAATEFNRHDIIRILQ